jgi:hypothetical protein
MDTHFIFIAHNSRYAALGIFRAAFGRRILSDDEHLPLRGKLYRSPKSGDTASDNEEINDLLLHNGRIQDRGEEIKQACC